MSVALLLTLPSYLLFTQQLPTCDLRTLSPSSHLCQRHDLFLTTFPVLFTNVSQVASYLSFHIISKPHSAPILLLTFRTPTRKELVPDLSRMPGWKTKWSSHRTQALPACPFVLPWMSVLPSPSLTNKYLANILLQNFNFSFSPPR